MENCCPRCKSTVHKTEEIKIEYTGEIITVIKCKDCGAVINAEIERPPDMALRKIHGAREIRFSENEQRNFASTALSLLDTQIKLLAAIASVTGVDDVEIKNIIKDRFDEKAYYGCIIEEDDLSSPVGL